MGPTAGVVAVMVFNDLLMILLAFGLALMLRATLVSRLFPTTTTPHYRAGSLDLAYLGWFMLSYIVVSSRYGLYAANRGGRVAHEIRMVLQACLNAGLVLCGTLYMCHAEIISRMLVILLIMTSS
ncbi:MAG TPA: hypothetical protein VKT75_16230, partial [Acidobacteriaceae bacterium]|nr:hypothetical protein [Acidobacteriaceae bacterium]